MKKTFLLILMLGATAFAQKQFEVKNASKNYDVKIEVAKCDNVFCEGAAIFSLFKKGRAKPFQIFKVPDTLFWLDKNGQAQVNVTLLYDEQSALNFGDFNFDGTEDLAICDGKNGGYGASSYRVYLFSPQRKRFFLNAALTRLAQGEYLGMFKHDPKKETLQTFSKSGCCWHQTREFRVVNNHPQKILEVTEDAIGANDKVKITSRKNVKGRWRTTVKYEKLADQN